MRTANRRATRDQLTKRPAGHLPAGHLRAEHLPDGVGGTITGGPQAPIDLMDILNRGSRGVSGGGAESDAALVMAGNRLARGQDLAIALSDGSRITFASIDHGGADPRRTTLFADA